MSVEEHGRTFNAYREGKYLLPNDALEQERLDLAHEMWRLLLFGDLAWVPFADEPKQVLDIGTGTGIWAIEFAEQHPASNVIGTDISLIQPPEGSIPSNCTFERDDVEEQWVFDRLFDYIHLRAMLTCFNDHVGVVRRIYDNLKPGGWVEYHDYDPEVFGKDDANHEALLKAPIWDWSQRVFQGAARFGRDMMIARRYKQLLTDAGFVDVAEKIVLAPNKPWSEDPRERRIGQYMQANSIEMISGVSAKLLQANGMSLEEADDLIARCRECFQSKELHLYSRMYVVYGRKPRVDELPPKPKTPEAPETQSLPVVQPTSHGAGPDTKPVDADPAVEEIPLEATTGTMDQHLSEVPEQDAPLGVVEPNTQDTSTAEDTTSLYILPASEVGEQGAKSESVEPIPQEVTQEETKNTAQSPVNTDTLDTTALEAATFSVETPEISGTPKEVSTIISTPQAGSNDITISASGATSQLSAQPSLIQSPAEQVPQLATEPREQAVTQETPQSDAPETENTSMNAAQDTDETGSESVLAGAAQLSAKEPEPAQEKKAPVESQSITETKEPTYLDPITQDYHKELQDLAAADDQTDILGSEERVPDSIGSDVQPEPDDLQKKGNAAPNDGADSSPETIRIPPPAISQDAANKITSNEATRQADGKPDRAPIAMAEYLLGRKVDR